MKLRRMAKRAEKVVRIGRVHVLGCMREFAWTRSRLHLPRNEPFPVRTSQNDGVSVRLVDPEETIERPLPHMPGEQEPHERFVKDRVVTTPATFVAEIKRGRFWGYYGGSVFTEDGRLVPELSKDVWGPHLHSAYVRTRMPVPKFLPGRTLSLVTPEAAGNYHHWTMDFQPRAGLAERAGYQLKDFDHVLVKDRGFPYQKEAYRRLGIEPAKLIRVDDHTHFLAESLVVPAIRHDNTRVNRADMLYSRSLYLPEEPAPTLAQRRIYVSRRDASFRRVLNEHEIMPLLKRHGFEEVAMSEMSVAEQARVFSEAAVLVGPNGSALANLVYANRACRVVEFFAPGWVVSYNWMICANLGIDYTAIIGEGPRPAPGSLPREIKQDIHLDPEVFARVLSEVTPAA
jgi:hypothetical protein